MTIATNQASPVDGPVGAFLAGGVVRYASMASEGVGDRVRRYRRLRKLSQQQLADAAQTDKGYISRLEAGKIAEPGVEVLRRIASALAVRVREVAPQGYYEDDDAAWEALLLADDRLTDEAKQSILYLGRAALADKERKRQAS